MSRQNNKRVRTVCARGYVMECAVSRKHVDVKLLTLQTGDSDDLQEHKDSEQELQSYMK